MKINYDTNIVINWFNRKQLSEVVGRPVSKEEFYDFKYWISKTGMVDAASVEMRELFLIDWPSDKQRRAIDYKDHLLELCGRDVKLCQLSLNEFQTGGEFDIWYRDVTGDESSSAYEHIINSNQRNLTLEDWMNSVVGTVMAQQAGEGDCSFNNNIRQSGGAI